MHKAKIGLLLVLGALLSACNAVPPTLVVMMITSTPDPRVVAVTVTPTGAQATSQATAEAPTAIPTAAPTNSAPTNAAPTAAVAATKLPPSATPAVLPPTIGAVPTSAFGPTQTLS